MATVARDSVCSKDDIGIGLLGLCTRLYTCDLGMRACESLQSCPTLCNPKHWPARPPVRGSLQARILEWVAMPSSRGIFPTQESNPHLQPASLTSTCIDSGFFTINAPREALGVGLHKTYDLKLRVKAYNLHHPNWGWWALSGVPCRPQQSRL